MWDLLSVYPQTKKKDYQGNKRIGLLQITTIVCPGLVSSQKCLCYRGFLRLHGGFNSYEPQRQCPLC